jgi:hypothetical protein
MLTVFTDGERFGRMQWWRHGVEISERVFQVARFPRVPRSLTRFRDKFGSQAKCEALAEKARAFAVQPMGRAGVNEGNRNLDSTVLTRYGKQEGGRIEEGQEAVEFHFEHAGEKWTLPRRYTVIRQHAETRPEAPVDF